MMYDTAIIGTGPAGLSAAINLKLHEKSVLWFGSPSSATRSKKARRSRIFPVPESFPARS